jgi:hypothetical protein
VPGCATLCREHILEDAIRPFVEACRRFEANRHEETGGGFAKAFQPISIADVRRAAAIKLDE